MTDTNLLPETLLLVDWLKNELSHEVDRQNVINQLNEVFPENGPPLHDGISITLFTFQFTI